MSSFARDVDELLGLRLNKDSAWLGQPFRLIGRKVPVFAHYVYISIGSGSVTEELGLHLDGAFVSSRSTATVHEVLEILAQVFALASEPMSLTDFTKSRDTAC